MSRRLVALVFGLVLTAAAPADGQSLRTVPLGHWAYGVADALLLRHPELATQVWLGNRPWREGDFAALWRAARRPGRGATDPLAAGWLELLGQEFELGPGLERTGPRWIHNDVSARYEGHYQSDDATFDPAFRGAALGDSVGFPPHRGVAQHDFAAQFGPVFALGWRYVLDSNIRNDPTRRTKLGIRTTEAVAFEVLEAYASTHTGPVWATLGRAELALGLGRATSPFVSESIPALDQVRIELAGDAPQRIRYTGLVAQLSRERPNRLLNERGNTLPGSVPTDSVFVGSDVTRWLYLQRVDWRVFDQLQVAISEAALVTGINRGFELRFANPMLPYLATQAEDDEVDSNDVDVSVTAEAVYTGLGSSRLYGLLYVQELFIDKDLRESFGNQLAWRVGGAWADPVGWRGGSVGAEYTRVDVFTYLHRGLNTNWETFGVPIGSSLGPDGDQAQAWVEYWYGPELRFSADVLGRRSGERDIDTIESATDPGNPEFPSGVVQREVRLGAEAWTVIPSWGIEGRARVGRRQVENLANVAGQDGDFWEASLALAYRFRFP